MAKDSFFDTSVIIHYASFSKNIKQELVKRCYEYIVQKKGKYLLCFYVQSEIKNRVRKRRIIYDEALRKIREVNYEIGSSKISEELNERDLSNAKKIYEIYKKIRLEDVLKIFGEEQSIFERKIDQFLKFHLDERVIPIEAIKLELINMLHDLIENYADCKVLASALQAQEERNNFYFVNADKHFDSNGYLFIQEDPRFKNYKFPELKNLLYE